MGSEDSSRVMGRTPCFVTEGTANVWSLGRPFFLQHGHRSPNSLLLLASTFLREEESVHFLSWELKQIHAEFKDRSSTVEDHGYEFPMNHSHDGLVAGCPDSIPGAIERIGDGRAQHVVQIHLCDLGNRGGGHVWLMLPATAHLPSSSGNWAASSFFLSDLPLPWLPSLASVNCRGRGDAGEAPDVATTAWKVSPV